MTNLKQKKLLKMKMIKIFDHNMNDVKEESLNSKTSDNEKKKS